MLGARPPFRRFMSAIRSSGSRRLGALSGRVREPGRIRREVGGPDPPEPADPNGPYSTRADQLIHQGSTDAKLRSGFGNR
jgi:hypothetical protein